MTSYTPGPDFVHHLVALKAAIDQVQPLADYRGNFSALHAMVTLAGALQEVIKDIAPFVGGAEEDAATLREQLNACCLERDGYRLRLRHVENTAGT